MTTATLNPVIGQEELTQQDVTNAFQKMWNTSSETPEGRRMFIILYERWQDIKSQYEAQQERKMRCQLIS